MGILCLHFTSTVFAADGFASLNGGTTGGEGGTAVTVNTEAELITYAQNSGSTKYIITIASSFTTSGNINIGSNKTIQGADPSVVITGDLRVGSNNVIIRNLTIRNPNGIGSEDGITIRDGKNVFVTNCTFQDCKDGSCDITETADYVTVSWCKFEYPTQTNHCFVMIGGNHESHRPHITLHHNWYAAGCVGRMPSTGFSYTHQYNDYFDCVGNNYCSRSRYNTEFLSENNYYDGVRDPVTAEDGGIMRTSGNIYNNCTGTIYPGTDTVFTPPYAYILEDPETAKENVIAGAGNVLPTTMWPYGDFTGNHIVEMNDMPEFLSYWLIEECNETEEIDLDDDCLVNFYEFSVLANNMKLTPEIALNTTSLEQVAGLGIDTPNQVFAVWNSGVKTLNYTVSDDVAWLSVSQDHGTSTGIGDKVLHTVHYDTDSLALGMHYATITISAPAASNNPRTIAVTLEVKQPEISLSTTSLEQVAAIGSDAPNQTFEVWNSSIETLNYTVSDDVAWLSVSEDSGSSTGPDDKTLHTVVYDTDSLALGTYYATITISDPAASNDPQTISVTLNVSEQGAFVAYNDMNPMNSTNATNVTEYDYSATNVLLKDFSTGDDLFFSMTCSYVGGYDSSGSGGNFDPGTDAYLAFNGIVDADGVYEIDNISDSYTITFNNLQPGREYTITLTANLDDSYCEDERYTKVTIEGAQTYTNASSSGVEVNSEASVSFCTGYNTENGYVAKWTGVTTGPDGSFSVKSEWDDYLDGSRAYAMSAFKLESQSP